MFKHGNLCSRCIRRCCDSADIRGNDCSLCFKLRKKTKEVVSFYNARKGKTDYVYLHNPPRSSDHSWVRAIPILPNNMEQTVLDPDLVCWILGEKNPGFLMRPDNYILGSDISSAMNMNKGYCAIVCEATPTTSPGTFDSPQNDAQEYKLIRAVKHPDYWNGAPEGQQGWTGMNFSWRDEK